MSFNWLYTVQERVMQPPPSLSVFLFYFSFLLFNFKIIFPFQFQRYWHETRNKYKGEILLKVFGIFFFFCEVSACFLLIHMVTFMSTLTQPQNQVTEYISTFSYTFVYFSSEGVLEKREIWFFSVCAPLNYNILQSSTVFIYFISYSYQEGI